MTLIFEKWIESCTDSMEQNETLLLTTTASGNDDVTMEKIENFFIADFSELTHLDSKNAIKIFTQKIND